MKTFSTNKKPNTHGVIYFKRGDTKPKAKYGDYSSLNKWIDKQRHNLDSGIASIGNIEDIDTVKQKIKDKTFSIKDSSSSRTYAQIFDERNSVVVIAAKTKGRISVIKQFKSDYDGKASDLQESLVYGKYNPKKGYIKGKYVWSAILTNLGTNKGISVEDEVKRYIDLAIKDPAGFTALGDKQYSPVREVGVNPNYSK